MTAARRVRPGLLIIVGLVLAAAGISAAVLSRPSAPSYPHAWCAPLLAEFYSRTGNQLTYEADLARLERTEHAPVDKLVADLQAYNLAHAMEANGDDLNAFGNIAATRAALRMVHGDLRTLNTACGQPAREAKNDTI